MDTIMSLTAAAMSTPLVRVMMNTANNGGGNTNGGLDITKILTGLRSSLGIWGTIIMGILGAAALIVAAYQLVTGLISHGKKQTNWFIVLGLAIVGAMFVGMTLGGFGNVFGNNAFSQLTDTTDDQTKTGIKWGGE